MLVGGFPPLLVCGAWSLFRGFRGSSFPCSWAPPLSKHLGEDTFSLGLPWNLPAVPGICAEPPSTLDGTSSQGHQLAMNSIPAMIISLRHFLRANFDPNLRLTRTNLAIQFADTTISNSKCIQMTTRPVASITSNVLIKTKLSSINEVSVMV